MTSLLDFISNELERKAELLKRIFFRISLDRLVLILASLGAFLSWIKFSLSGGALSSAGIGSFNLYSPSLLFWGLIFLPIVILAIIGIRWALFLLLVIVLSFALQFHWNYEHVQNIVSESAQLNNITIFANAHVYQPNVPYVESDISDIGNWWDDPWTRVFITINYLGPGFWIALIGIIIVSRKLGMRKFIIALVLSIALSLPGILTASFLTLGRSAFLRGDYLKSIDRYKIAMKINQTFGNRTLKVVEPYYLWVGESLFHKGIEDAPEVYLFLGNNLEQIDSFIESKEMYQKSMVLPPARKALARTMVKEASVDYNNNSTGAAMQMLEQALELDKNQIEALFYMTYISFVLKDRQSTLYYSAIMFDRCKEKVLRSDTYNVLGDIYNRTEEFANSRTQYQQSINTYDSHVDENFHGWTGLAGW